jgi:hypothetical protein
MKNLILLFALSFLTFCKSPSKPDKEQLLKVDREFSATAVEKDSTGLLSNLPILKQCFYAIAVCR